MTNDQYRSLWQVPFDSINYMVLNDNIDHQFGYLVVDGSVDAAALLNHSVRQGFYPSGSYLVELVTDFEDNTYADDDYPEEEFIQALPFGT